MHVGGEAKLFNHFGKQLGNFFCLLPVWPRNLKTNLVKRNKDISTYRNMQVNISSRLIHNHPKKGTNQTSFSWWTILKLAHPDNEILLDNKKWTTGTHNNRDEFQMNDAKLYRFTKATWYLITLYDILQRAKLQGQKIDQWLPEPGAWGKD